MNKVAIFIRGVDRTILKDFESLAEAQLFFAEKVVARKAENILWIPLENLSDYTGKYYMACVSREERKRMAAAYLDTIESDDWKLLSPEQKYKESLAYLMSISPEAYENVGVEQVWK